MIHLIFNNTDYSSTVGTAINTDHSASSNLTSDIMQYPAAYCTFYFAMRATNVIKHIFLLLWKI